MDRAIAGRAAAQHGLVTRVQLMLLGLSGGEIEYRSRVGRLHLIHRGVYAVGHRRLTEQGEFLAAVLSVGSDALLAGPSAAALEGLRQRAPGEDVHVLVPRDVPSRPGLRVHSTTSRMPPARMKDAVPTTPIELTILGCAAQLRPLELRRVVRQALVLKRVTVPMLVTVLAQNRGRRGVARLAAVLADAMPTRSELEDATVAMLRAHDLPPFRTNVVIAGDEVDVYFVEHGVVIEADGARFHDNPLARADDAAKAKRLQRRGLHVERVRWRQVTVEQPPTIARIRRALERRNRRKPE